MAEGQDSAAERSEAPTAKRLREAREKGDIARSRELDTALILVVGLAALMVLGPRAVASIEQLAAAHWALERERLFEPMVAPRALLDAILDSLWAIAPFLALMFLVALTGPMLMGGFLFSVKAMRFDVARMDPLKGIARMFSLHSLVELLKSLAKVLLCALAAYLVVRYGYHDWLALGRAPLGQAMAGAFVLVFTMVAALAAVMALIALVDVPWQAFEHTRKLRMTRDDIKREQKETDGNPELKGRLRSEQRRISQQHMLQDVATADVVITNPRHFAVALRYRDGDPAPVLVARGVDELAQRIRAIAVDADVRVVEAPPLARALYHHTRVGETVRTELWQAVAQVLAFVVQLERAAAQGRREGRRRPGQRPRLPTPPSDAELAVPRRLSDPEPFAGDDI